MKDSDRLHSNKKYVFPSIDLLGGPSAEFGGEGAGEASNKSAVKLRLKELFETPQWLQCGAVLPAAIGRCASGEPIIIDLAQTPHVLIGGMVGKTVCINTMMASLLFRRTPQELRFIMFDKHCADLEPYNPLPHMLAPVITDERKMSAALSWLACEMDRRLEIFEKAGAVNIAKYNEAVSLAGGGQNKNSAEIMPYIVCVVDEFSGAMILPCAEEFSANVARLTQLGRAAGICLLLSTKRTTKDTITDFISANFLTRIAFSVFHLSESHAVLGEGGAEMLERYSGDMLVKGLAGAAARRAQCAYIAREEIVLIAGALKRNGKPQYNQELLAKIAETPGA